MALLSIENLTIRFGSLHSSSRPAVDRLSLHIGPGESLGLVGESGSGKSVTALATMRLLDPAAQVAGSIYFAAPTGSAPLDLLTLAPEAMRRLRGSSLGMIFQEPMTSLNPVMPVGEQIAEAIRAHHPRHSPPRGARRHARSHGGCCPTRSRPPFIRLPAPVFRWPAPAHSYRHGYRQPARAAHRRRTHHRARRHRPGPDSRSAAGPARALQPRDALHLHDLAVVSRVADRVAVMRGGLLLEQGPARSIFRTPLHPYTRSLLGAVPTLSTPIDQPLATVSGEPGSAAYDSPLREATPGHWVRG